MNSDAPYGCRLMSDTPFTRAHAHIHIHTPAYYLNTSQIASIRMTGEEDRYNTVIPDSDA